MNHTNAKRTHVKGKEREIIAHNLRNEYEQAATIPRTGRKPRQILRIRPPRPAPVRNPSFASAADIIGASINTARMNVTLKPAVQATMRSDQAVLARTQGQHGPSVVSGIEPCRWVCARG